MAFKITEWELSNEVEEEIVQAKVEAGPQYLVIVNADYDDSDSSNPIYSLTLKSLTNEGVSTFRYWLNSANKDTGVIEKNTRVRGTLISLGKALFGTPVGIPMPGDVIGGVVYADVQLGKPNAAGKVYTRIYHFDSVPKEVAESYADIEQYYAGMEDEIPMTDEQDDGYGEE